MIWASCEFDGFTLNYLPVLNAGGWWGKTWLIELLGAGPPLWVVVEAGSITDAIEVLSDDPEFGYVLHVRERDLGAYPEDERQFDNKGRVIDTDKVRVHGWDRCDLPYRRPLPPRWTTCPGDRPPPIRRLRVQLSP